MQPHQYTVHDSYIAVEHVFEHTGYRNHGNHPGHHIDGPQGSGSLKILAEKQRHEKPDGELEYKTPQGEYQGILYGNPGDLCPAYFLVNLKSHKMAVTCGKIHQIHILKAHDYIAYNRKNNHDGHERCTRQDKRKQCQLLLKEISFLTSHIPTPFRKKGAAARPLLYSLMISATSAAACFSASSTDLAPESTSWYAN